MTLTIQVFQVYKNWKLKKEKYLQKTLIESPCTCLHYPYKDIFIIKSVKNTILKYTSYMHIGVYLFIQNVLKFRGGGVSGVNQPPPIITLFNKLIYNKSLTLWTQVPCCCGCPFYMWSSHSRTWYRNVKTSSSCPEEKWHPLRTNSKSMNVL